MAGHLTHDDRRRIAEWLAEGLAYAEIARRLGRSRSTIGREIARNGGPHAYRADRAQQATGRRARRRTPSPHPVAHTAGGDAYGRDPELVREFAEQFTTLMVRTGLPAMPARVLTDLFLSDTGSRTAAELVERLRVSPASISKAVGYLELVGLVRRERDTRRERYLLGDDIWHRVWAASSQSIAMWADEARHGADILGTATPAGARLRTTSEFFGFIGHDMVKAAEHWRRTLSL